MGDKLTIPRTFAGKLGVADVNDSIKRTHAMAMPFIANSTTGEIFGNTTTAPNLFARNVTLEQVIVSFFLQSTATTGTTLLAFRLMNGATTVFQSKKFNSTAQLPTTGWINKAGTNAGTLSVTNLSATDKLSLVIDTNSPAAQVKKLNIWLRYKEREDT